VRRSCPTVDERRKPHPRHAVNLTKQCQPNQTMTGLERGEMCGLQWLDIDLDARRLNVERERWPVGK